MMPLNPRISSYQDKVVWIVGATSGIGEAITHELAQQGARLFISGRRAERLTFLASQHPDQQITPLALDVKNLDSIQAAYQQINRPIDLAIYVSGIYHPMRAQDFDLTLAQEMIETNLMGAMNFSSVIVPHLIQRQTGAIAMISSVAGYSGLPKSLVYGPTKAALINFCEALYYDLSPQGIGVYLVNPGFVDTPATKNNDFYMPQLVSSEVAAKTILKEMKLGHFEIHFPKGFSRFLKLLRLLPYPIYFYLLKKFIKV